MDNTINFEVENKLLKQSHELLINGLTQLNVALNRAAKEGTGLDYEYYAHATKKLIDNAKNIIK